MPHCCHTWKFHEWNQTVASFSEWPKVRSQDVTGIPWHPKGDPWAPPSFRDRREAPPSQWRPWRHLVGKFWWKLDENRLDLLRSLRHFETTSRNGLTIEVWHMTTVIDICHRLYGFCCYSFISKFFRGCFRPKVRSFHPCWECRFGMFGAFEGCRFASLEFQGFLIRSLQGLLCLSLHRPVQQNCIYKVDILKTSKKAVHGSSIFKL